MPLFKELTKPFRAVVRPIPLVGYTISKVLRETARVADQVTRPGQKIIKSAVAEVTGTRRINNRRVDAQKAQIIKEAKERILSNMQTEENNAREIIINEIKMIKSAVENLEQQISDDMELEGEQGEDIEATNPFFAYDDCLHGETQDLNSILMLDCNNEIYNFFMDLNPLQEAYLSYIESETIGMEAFKMLVAHEDKRIDVSKKDLLENISHNIKNAIAEKAIKKVERIVDAGTEMEGEEKLLIRLNNCPEIYQKLIKIGVIIVNEEIVSLKNITPQNISCDLNIEEQAVSSSSSFRSSR